MLALADLLALWLQRDKDAGPRKSRDRETLEYFEGRVAVPLPELERSEQSMVANLYMSGLTAKAHRVASIPPQPMFVASSQSKAAHVRVQNKKRAILGMWDENKLALQRRQRARWLIGYASSPVLVRPQWKNGTWSVKWEMRSALAAYPAPTPAHIDMEPHDVIFASSQSAAKLQRDWSDAAAALRAMVGKATRDATVTLIEYCGPDEYIYAAVGTRDPYDNSPILGVGTVTAAGNRWCVELARAENRVGRCCAIVPNSISLEAPMSEFEGMKSLYQAQAKLMAMEYRAVANSVDPPVWFVESDTGGEIVTVADGPSGIVGHVKGGTLQPLNIQPGFQTYPTIDRLERSQRLQAGIPSDLQGEGGTNIRTAKRGAELLASVIDFPIQEYQEILAESQKLEDDIAMETSLAYFPDLKKTWAGFEFTPKTTFTKGDWHTVEYSLAGADANGQVIRVGQLVGTGLISKRTARTLLPDIKDGELEDDYTVFEQIQQGLLAEFMQPDPTGNLNVIVKNRVAELVRDGKHDLVDAINVAQREAQERAATATGTVDPGAPEAQPGLAPPGVGVEAATAGAPQSDLGGLNSLLMQLRGPQAFESPGERAAGVAAAV